MRNCRTYSNSSGVDLKDFKEKKSVYFYTVPIVKQFDCGEIDKMYDTKEEKIAANGAYEKNLARFWGQLSANMKNAKSIGNTNLEQSFRNHYNYHLAQRQAAQSCTATLKYGGDASEVVSFSFPKATKKPPIQPEPQKPQPEPPKPEPIKPTVKKPNGISLEPKKPISEVKTESSGFKLTKDLMIGLLGGVLLYLVVLK